MGRGVIESGLFRAEQYQLEQRTADPASPEPNEEWLRVDIKPTYEDADGVSQTGVAQYRRANSSGTIETAPVAALGDSTNADVIDKVRAYVDAGGSPTGTGFIPHATSGAAYPHKRLQHPTDGQVALHDSLTANTIPDSGVSRWTYDNADLNNGDPLDVWGGNDGTNNGATTGVTGKYNEAFDFDGIDDTVTADVKGYSASDAFSLPIWVNTGSTSNFEVIFSVIGSGGIGTDELLIQQTDTNTTRLLGYVSGSTDVNIETSSTIDDNNWHLLTLVWDGPNSEAIYYLDDATQIGTATIESSSTDFITSTNWTWGARSDGSEYYAGKEDDPRLYDKALSSTEVSNLFNTGSISG